MAQLLVRVTGSRNAPLDPAVQRLLAAPDEFLSSYGDDRQGRALVGFSAARSSESWTVSACRCGGPSGR